VFRRNLFENSRPGGIAVLEVRNGRKRREPPRFVPLKRTELRGQATGPLADLQLLHTYGYSKEQCAATLEAVYRFPLPGDAAVTGVTVRFGEVVIETELKEREEAEKDYERAREEGRQAALLTRESPDVFTLQVTGLQPDQDVVIETRFVVRAKTESPGWTLRVPLTTGPRYVREDESGSRHSKGQPLALLRDPGHRFALDLRVENADEIHSNTHPIAIQAAGGGTRLTLEAGEVVPDRDFVLSWQPQGEPASVGLDVQFHADPDDDNVYFMATVVPPKQHERGSGVAREVILLLDRSGSMQGPKWEAADWAVQTFLAGLNERDRLAFGRFHTDVYWMDKAPRGATPAVIERARDFLEHRDSGGTNLGVAMEQALDQERGDGERARHVLIITDAQVTDAGRLLRLAEEESRRKDRRRISLLCIDAAPNSHLVHQLAERGGGVARFLTSSPEAEDITTALEEVLADWAEPVMSDLRLEIDQPFARAAGYSSIDAAEEGWSGIDLGDLTAGRPRWLVGRVEIPDAREMWFRISGPAGIVASITMPIPAEGVERPVIKALFGARRIAELEYLMTSFREGADLADELRRLGYDAEQVLATGKKKKVYAENVARAAREPLKALLVRESLDFGLASAETAFVAVRTESGKRVEGTVVVGTALPAGWSEDFMYYAQPQDGMATQRVMLQKSGGPGMIHRLAKFLAPDGPADFDAVEGVRQTGEFQVFGGVPRFDGNEAVLFDTERDKADGLKGRLRLTAVSVDFPDDRLQPEEIDSKLVLLIYVGDRAVPRARVKLADLIRQGGRRPLNIQRSAREAIVLVLADPSGAWTTSAPRMTVTLHL
jgi:Ca-activated chloride channel family protein